MSVDRLEEKRRALRERIEVDYLNECGHECNLIECLETFIDALDEKELDKLLSATDEELERIVGDWEWTCRYTNDTLDACMEHCYESLYW